MHLHIVSIIVLGILCSSDICSTQSVCVFLFSQLWPIDIFVPTPLEGGGTVYSAGFFLFWPINIFIVES